MAKFVHEAHTRRYGYAILFHDSSIIIMTILTIFLFSMYLLDSLRD